MDMLEGLVAKFSAQFETEVKKEVPVTFKLAVSNAINELSQGVQRVKGHLRHGFLDYSFLRRNDGVLFEGHEEDGTCNAYAAAGLFKDGSAEQLAAVVVHRNLWHYTFEVFVKKDNKRGADAILNVITRHLTEENPVSGKVINLKGDIRTLDNLDWDAVAIPPQYRQELERTILFPMRNYKELKEMRLFKPRGVLFAGEVGMGKSLAGKIIAKKVTEFGGTVIMTTPAEVGSLPTPEWKYVFEVAGTLRPTLLYVEDVETSGTSGSPKMYQLSEYLDGLEDRKDVMLLVTTNELDSLDRRLRERPGRIDRVLTFDPKKPEFAADWRKQVLAIHLNGNRGLQADVEEIAGMVGNRPYSGAQLAELVSSAIGIVLHGKGLAQAASPDRKVVLDSRVIAKAIEVLDRTYNLRRPIGFTTNQKT